MSLPLRRLIRWPLVLIVALIAIREWNIRRHEPTLENWPRVDQTIGAP